MEISDVKRQVIETLARAKRQASDRRARVEATSKAYAAFLDRHAVPVFRQVASVLKAEGYPFNVNTPAGSVSLTPERGGDDSIELALETTGAPLVTLRARRSWGRRVTESVRTLGDPAALGDDDVLAALLAELEPFVER